MDNGLLGSMLADLFELEAVVGLALLALVIGVLVHSVLRDGFPAKQERDR
jgi:hypothetical protein